MKLIRYIPIEETGETVVNQLRKEAENQGVSLPDESDWEGILTVSPDLLKFHPVRGFHLKDNTLFDLLQDATDRGVIAESWFLIHENEEGRNEGVGILLRNNE